MGMTITPLRACLGAVVEGLDLDDLSAEVESDLTEAWHQHMVLFFPQTNLTPAQQMRLAAVFGPKLAATTEEGNDYRGAPSLADEGFPEILLLDTSLGHKPKTTNVWHTDVTFSASPPIGSLFVMERASDHGGDTMWSNQRAAYEGLSEPIRTLIDGLTAVHGRPPITGVSAHPMVQTHPATDAKHLFVNRGWTNSIKALSTNESTHLLNLLFAQAERPEYQVRWTWRSGDAALWDNRCTMHYAVDDYGSSPRRARRVTIYS